jgi:anti-sigma factor ChrR (cupin superfamily)
LPRLEDTPEDDVVADFAVVDVGDAPATQVGPGCVRRDFPSRDGVRIWLVDIAPGSEWPHVDIHDAQGEDILVVSGELIEGDRTIPAGSFLQFAPHSRHRPRTLTGVRLFGFNLLPRETQP